MITQRLGVKGGEQLFSSLFPLTPSGQEIVKRDTDEKGLSAEQSLKVPLLEGIRGNIEIPRPRPAEQPRGAKRARDTADPDAQSSLGDGAKKPESAPGPVAEGAGCQSRGVEALEQ